MARIRHVALVVKDLEATADFYQKAFGLKRSPLSEGPTARRIYMSDGHVNLALLQYKGETGSGLKDPGGFVGVHHFGFQVDDLSKQQKRSRPPAASSSSISAIPTTTISSASSRTPTASSSTSTGRAGR